MSQSERKLSSIMVTGGSGFIGSNLVRHLLAAPDFHGILVNVDKLTYAGNPENLLEVEREHGGRRYFFEKADICRQERMLEILRTYEVDAVIHLAAESHVDRSIVGPGDFIRTNLLGTFSLLEAVRERWGRRRDVLFHHVSTDEVFGSLGAEGCFTESSPFDPHSPYSATKAGSDHLASAAGRTYGLPVTISNCSNNYGPYQFPEKLIPLMILNLLEEKPLPVYGDGANVRDWLHVEDHSRALWAIVRRGRAGERYLIGGLNEWRNLELVNHLCERVAALRGRSPAEYRRLISFVPDRPGHDLRYAIDCSKLRAELGWQPEVDFADGLERTIRWYMQNPAWVQRVRSGEYREWIQKNYAARAALSEIGR